MCFHDLIWAMWLHLKLKVICRLNIRKTVTRSNNSDNWPKRNSAYFTSIDHSQNLLIFSQNCWCFSRTSLHTVVRIYFMSKMTKSRKCDFSSIFFKIISNGERLDIVWYKSNKICHAISWKEKNLMLILLHCTFT